MLVIAHRGASARPAREHAPRLRARDRARRRLRRARRAQRPQRHARRPEARRRLPDARRGARPVPRPDRRDGRAEAAARRHRPARARPDARRRRARLLPARARTRRPAQLRPAVRTVQHVGFGVSIRRAAGAWAVGFRNERLTRRGLDAARRYGLETTVYTVNDAARIAELDASASPASSRIVRIEHWQPWAVVRQADQLRALRRDPRDDLRADRQRRGACGRHVGDQARPGSRHLHAGSPGRGRSA